MGGIAGLFHPGSTGQPDPAERDALCSGSRFTGDGAVLACQPRSTMAQDDKLCVLVSGHFDRAPVTGQSSAEVLLDYWARLGIDALAHFEGAFVAAIFVGMATIATVSKRDFSFLGKFLFIGMILLVVASLANIFFAVPAVSLTISAIAVLIFSAYLLYDISNIVRGGETNYVTATLSVYLSLYNIFISLLNLLLAFSGNRD